MAIPGRVIERRRRLRQWLRRLLLTGLISLAAVIGYAFYLQITSVLDFQMELSTLKTQAQAIQAENQRLAEQLSLQDDPQYLEYLARRELGLIKPGEVKYILPPEMP